MKETHDFSGFSETSMTKHFGGSTNMEIDFVEVFDLFDAFESDFVGLFSRDLLL